VALDFQKDTVASGLVARHHSVTFINDVRLAVAQYGQL
jgi:hypothetical protein